MSNEWAPARISAFSSAVERHPWSNPVEAEGGDEGDPRDMTPQAVARGGMMTVIDRAAWLREINNAADGPRSAAMELGGYRRCARFTNLVEGEAFAAFIERWVRQHPDDSFEGACGSFAPPSPEAAAVLRDHWIYGARFWAWWSGIRHTDGVVDGPVMPPRPETNAHGVDVSKIREGDYVRTSETWLLATGPLETGRVPFRDQHGKPAWVFARRIVEHRAAPRVVLPDGREVVPDRMWNCGPSQYARVGGKMFGRATAEAPWRDLSEVMDGDRQGSGMDRVWPPADLEGA